MNILDRTPSLRHDNYALSDSASDSEVVASGKPDRADDAKIAAVPGRRGARQPAMTIDVFWFGGLPFSRPGLNVPRQRAPPRSGMASCFRGHRALARREASLRVAAPAASLVRVGRAGLDGAWGRP